MFLSFNDYVLLYEPAPGVPLKEVLTRALGVPAVVDKRREIFFIEHVKFHLDREQLQRQCASYLVRFEILPKDLAPVSYEAFRGPHRSSGGAQYPAARRSRPSGA